MREIARRRFVAAAGALLATPAIKRASAQAVDYSKGVWSPVRPWPDVGIHLHVLPTHKILTFSDDAVPGLRERRADYSQAFIVDIPPYSPPATTWLQIDNNVTNLFCAGHTFLPDGRLLVLGGHEGRNYFGSTDTTIFQYQGGYQWIRQSAPMNAGRWYASAITLGTGEVLVLSGAIDGINHQNPLPQVWKTNEGGGWRNLTTALLNIDNYPKTYVLGNGLVFVVGPEVQTRFLNTAGTGAWIPGPNHVHPARRKYGSSVMYDANKFLVMGGANTNSTTPTNTAEIIDMNSPAPAWQFTSQMRYARKHCNATLLPDGKVLVTGGSASTGVNDAAGAVFAAEMWDPTTGKWDLMSSAQVPRIYHSSAVLLPDARVLVAGGGRPKAKNGGQQNLNAELFWPPYLWRGPRPTIASAPTSITYGQTFDIITPNAGDIMHVRLMSYGSTTHTFNMNQRMRTMAFTQAPAQSLVKATIGPNRNLQPPGYYMLFILNSKGVPSYAWNIHLS